MMGKKIKQKKVAFRRGFSIVEALIAIVILTLGFTAGMGLLSSSVRTVGETNDLTIATYLAEEGIEIARLKRDNNILQHYNGTLVAWDSIGGGNTFTNCASGGGGGCTVNAPTISSSGVTITPCSGCDTGVPLYKTTTSPTGQYTTSVTTSTTNLRRLVTATPIGTAAYEIASTVWYTSRGTERSITLKDVLYNTGAF